jgi:hypothetical protein
MGGSNPVRIAQGSRGDISLGYGANHAIAQTVRLGYVF